MREKDELPLLSRKERTILDLLLSAAGREMYGLELVEGSGGRLARGTVYVTLNRMEDKGYVESRRDDTPHVSGTRRRLYRVTGYGQRVHQAWDLARASLASAEAVG